MFIWNCVTHRVVPIHHSPAPFPLSLAYLANVVVGSQGGEREYHACSPDPAFGLSERPVQTPSPLLWAARARAQPLVVPGEPGSIPS